jgi:hypothetical protein
LDGAAFDDFAGFCAEFSRSVLGGEYEWKGSLDAFNDLLRGGFGTPDGPWVLRWCSVARSREALGWTATKLWLTDRVAGCHPSNVDHFRARLAEAERRRGDTLFDEILAILRDHGAGGGEAEDGIVLWLED